ncbi:MAG: hypothetical protein H0X45_02665 [Planctomycetes bacterium]|nr:hypothetical protein [Planctomycetota bacterium]
MASITPERRARLERGKANNTGRGNFYSMKGKEHDVIRMLPLGPNDDVGVKFVYYFIDKKSYVCNFETHKVPGVIVTAKRALQRIKDSAAQDMAKVIDDARRGKFLMKVISRADTEPHVQVFEAPKAIYIAAFNALDKDGEDVSHNKEGRDIRWSKQGGTSGKATKYDTRLLDKSPLHDDKATRLRLKEESAKIDLHDLTKPNENGAVEALRSVIPKNLWALIRAEVMAVAGETSSGGDEDAVGTDDEDDVAPPPKAKSAPKPTADDADDEDLPPAKTAKKAAAVVEDDEDDAPPAKASKPAAKAAVVDDEDEDLPPPKAAKKAVASADDEDDEAPKAAANKKKYEVPEDDAPAPKASKRAAIADDEDD